MNDTFDWDLLMSSRLNAILCGNRANLDAMLSRVRAQLAHPLHEWSFVEGSYLPAIRNGTLVVRDLDAATLDAQRRFLEWLAAHRAVRVITLTEVSLFDLTAAGAVLAELYYRLNPIFCALDWNRAAGSPSIARKHVA
jgi:hypothetical protein